ncbi:MAG: hypothetical protein CM1200mP18_08520 [Gammaproteobacteria bacterium]|nr:MAG: hypothetical protein CM1200mP18_08520 [Gammaproteobacteria bacterium]
MNADCGHQSRHSIDKQVMWTRLISVVEEQAQALLRTAFGSVVREAGDCQLVCMTSKVRCWLRL